MQHRPGARSTPKIDVDAENAGTGVYTPSVSKPAPRGWLRFVNFATTDEFDSASAAVAARSRQRYRRVGASAVAYLVARVVTFTSTLVVIPVAARHLGTEKFGLLMLVTSFIALLAFADFGLGSGLVNAIAEADARDDRELAASAVSTAFFMLAGIALVGIVVLPVVVIELNWAALLHTGDTRDAPIAVAVVGAAFFLTLPFSLVDRVQLGYQESFLNGLWLAAGSLLSVAGVLVFSSLKMGLPWLVGAVVGGPLIAHLFNAIILVTRRRTWLLPRLKLVRRATMRHLVRLGVLFFVLQLVWTLAFASDNLVIARVLDAHAVGQYSVPYRLFTALPLLLIVFLNPLWPAYREALTRGDMRWAERTLVFSVLGVAAVVAFASVVLALLARPIVAMWAGAQYKPSNWLVAGLACWAVLMVIGGVFSMFLNAANVLHFQVITGITMAISAIAAKVVLAERYGLPGVVWATVIVYTTITLVPTIFYIRRAVARIRRGEVVGDINRTALAGAPVDEYSI
jgi:O-antigen/teichoic acid export membrane protein